ncbi:MAG: PD40 domain-containing protein [Chitinophagaceae bacterium]|nr:PD40 domain-containing protein [Chitinophagaceae bacterium]
MDADGSNEIRITNRPGFDGGPTLSPDGTTIAFTVKQLR